MKQPSGYATLSIEEIHAAKAKGQVVFQQVGILDGSPACFIRLSCSFT